MVERLTPSVPPEPETQAKEYGDPEYRKKFAVAIAQRILDQAIYLNEDQEKLLIEIFGRYLDEIFVQPPSANFEHSKQKLSSALQTAHQEFSSQAKPILKAELIMTTILICIRRDLASYPLYNEYFRTSAPSPKLVALYKREFDAAIASIPEPPASAPAVTVRGLGPAAEPVEPAQSEEITKVIIPPADAAASVLVATPSPVSSGVPVTLPAGQIPRSTLTPDPTPTTTRAPKNRTGVFAKAVAISAIGASTALAFFGLQGSRSGENAESGSLDSIEPPTANLDSGPGEDATQASQAVVEIKSADVGEPEIIAPAVKRPIPETRQANSFALSAAPEKLMISAEKQTRIQNDSKLAELKAILYAGEMVIGKDGSIGGGLVKAFRQYINLYAPEKLAQFETFLHAFNNEYSNSYYVLKYGDLPKWELEAMAKNPNHKRFNEAGKNYNFEEVRFVVKNLPPLATIGRAALSREKAAEFKKLFLDQLELMGIKDGQEIRTPLKNPHSVRVGDILKTIVVGHELPFVRKLAEIVGLQEGLQETGGDKGSKGGTAKMAHAGEKGKAGSAERFDLPASSPVKAKAVEKVIDLDPYDDSPAVPDAGVKGTQGFYFAPQSAPKEPAEQKIARGFRGFIGYESNFSYRFEPPEA